MCCQVQLVGQAPVASLTASLVATGLVASIYFADIIENQNQ
jgi:hypothetical protein